MTFNLPNLRSIFQPTTNTRGNVDTILDNLFNDIDHRSPYAFSSGRESGFYPQLGDS